MTTDDAEADGPTIVLHEQAIGVETFRSQEGFNFPPRFCQRCSYTRRDSAYHYCRIAEARIVGRDQMESASERRDEIAVLMG